MQVFSEVLSQLLNIASTGQGFTTWIPEPLTSILVPQPTCEGGQAEIQGLVPGHVCGAGFIFTYTPNHLQESPNHQDSAIECYSRRQSISSWGRGGGVPHSLPYNEAPSPCILLQAEIHNLPQTLHFQVPPALWGVCWLSTPSSLSSF